MKKSDKFLMDSFLESNGHGNFIHWEEYNSLLEEEEEEEEYCEHADRDCNHCIDCGHVKEGEE